MALVATIHGQANQASAVPCREQVAGQSHSLAHQPHPIFPSAYIPAWLLSLPSLYKCRQPALGPSTLLPVECNGPPLAASALPLAVTAMMPTNVNMPAFPLRRAPLCRKCGRICVREPRGNRFCYCCPCSGDARQPTWCTWDDGVGVHPGNPLCDCAFYCRISATKAGKLLETCPIGYCSMSIHKSTAQASPHPDHGYEALLYRELQSPPYSAQRRHSLGGSSPSYSPPRLASIEKPPPRYTFSPRTSFGDESQSPNHHPPSQFPFPHGDDEFIRLLEHVLDVSSRTRFPRAFTDTSSVTSVLPGTSAAQSTSPAPFRIQSATELERRSKIDAAGELFVFTFLQQFLDDEIYISDWQSETRNYVKQHPDFQSWPDWNGFETSDIVYPDNDGTLTALLVENGYLNRDQWLDQKPEYFIEVKSTLNGRDHGFYLTNSQYTRMQQLSHPWPHGQLRPQIHVIARVSNMQENDIDLRFYIDPEALRRQNRLSFRQVWMVEDPAAQYH